MSNDLSETIQRVVLDHHEAVFCYAYRLCGTRSDAEDLTQQTFLIAHQKLEQLRQKDCVKSWLFTILRNLFLKEARRRRPQMWDQERLEEHPADEPEPRPIDEDSLHQTLSELPELHRLVVVMFYFEGLSYREMADRLDIPLGTVMSRLARAKQTLRTRLAIQADGKSSANSEDMSTSSRSGN